ncbi:hypothetical protein WJX74_003437, partial [Apatococcus lobatus]
MLSAAQKSYTHFLCRLSAGSYRRQLLGILTVAIMEGGRSGRLSNGVDAASKGSKSPFKRMSTRRTSSRLELPESSPAQLDTRGGAMQGAMRSPFESAPPLHSDDEDEDPAELLQMLRIKDLDNDKEYNVD